MQKVEIKTDAEGFAMMKHPLFVLGMADDGRIAGMFTSKGVEAIAYHPENAENMVRALTQVLEQQLPELIASVAAGGHRHNVNQKDN